MGPREMAPGDAAVGELEYRWLQSLPEVADLVQSRHQIIERDPDCTPCQTLEYVNRWLGCLGEGKTLQVVSIWRSQELVAMLLLADRDGIWETIGDRERWIVGLVGTSSEAAWNVVVDALAARRHDWHEVRLRIDAPQKAAGLLTALRHSSLNWVNLKYSQVTRRPGAGLRPSGLTPAALSSPSRLEIIHRDLAAFTERLMHYSIQSPLRRQPSHFLDPRQRALLMSFISDPLPQHTPWVARLTSGEQETALAIGLTWRDRATVLTAAANPLWALHGPLDTLADELRHWAACESFALPLPELPIPFWAHQWHTEVVITASRARRWRYALPQLTAELAERQTVVRGVAALLDRHVFGPLRRHSLRDIVTMAARDVAEFIHARHCWIVVAPDEQPVAPVISNVPVALVRADHCWLDRIAAFYGAPYGSGKYELYRRRFAENADCFLGLVNGNIVCVIWGMYRQDEFYQGRLSLTPESGEVVLGDAFTSPIYRGRNLFPCLLAQIVSDYVRRRQRPIAAIADYNRSSLRAVEKVGFRPIRRIPYQHLFGIRVR